MNRALLAPRMLGLHAAAVLALAAAVLLGLWQYGVWQHGREDQATSLVHAPAKPLSRVMSADEAFPGAAVGQPVRFTGRWVTGSTLYVSGRPLDGRPGVWQVTPVAVCDPARDCSRAPAMLVVRGWAPSVSAAPAPPRGALTMTGWLQPGEGSTGSDPNPGDDVLPQLRVVDALPHVHQDLYGGYAILRSVHPIGSSATTTTREALGTLRAVTPASLPRADTSTALRNLLYALEWWAFGGFAVYVWWRWCRDEVSRVTGVASTA